jgi:glycosyltransferase involved in cell wall biosynthesis
MKVRRLMSRRSLNHYQERHVLLAAIERHLHKKTSALLGNSLAVVSDLVAETGTRNKVGLIRNGIEISDPISGEIRKAARKQWRLSRDTIVFAVVANLIPYKGHRDLFAAFGLIVNVLQRPWRLLLIGRDHGLGAELHKSAEEAGFADNVLWLGERTDVQDLLNIVDVTVMPSHEEGFSNSLIEAMARGLPAIATAVGGNVEAISHEVTGLLVPPRDPEALAEALFRLYEDPLLRQRLGVSARARAVSEFSIDDCVGRYLNLYRGWQSIGNIPVQDLIDGHFSGSCA